MKKPRKFKSPEFEKVKNHIRRVYPRANRIEVKVDQLPNGEFKSFVRVLAPQKKELIARKKDKDIKRSIEKSHLAIIRQIHRIKTRLDPMNVVLPEAVSAV